MFFLLAVCAALAGTDWQAIGPERGHVLDADVRDDRVSVVTRVGVMSAGGDLGDWVRDPRFPPDTRRIALGPEDTAWAAPSGQLWHVTDGPSQHYAVPSGSTVVDLETTAGGAVLAAVRGQTAGLVRVEPGGEARWVLSEIDPWCLHIEGEQVWLGTVGHGLWVSEDGGTSFVPLVEEGVITALGRVDGTLLAAFADGRVLHPADGTLLLEQPGTTVTAIADDHGVPLLTLAGDHGAVGPVARLVDGALEGLSLRSEGAAGGLIRPLGAWSLPDGGVLVGTFREGPLRVEQGAWSFARSGFRATVGRGAAVDSGGRLLLGLMGTGVFLSEDDGASWSAEHSGAGPVTDAIAVVSLGNAIAALDFEGVAVLGPDGRWSRFATVDNPRGDRRNGLELLAPGPGGSWWGVDVGGQLWQRVEGAWSRCETGSVSWIGGGAEASTVVTAAGHLQLEDCGAAATPVGWEVGTVDWGQARATGPWLAVPGALWHEGQRVADLPPVRVSTIKAREGGGGGQEDVLVATGHGEVFACSVQGCGLVGSPIPTGIEAVGWLGDGRVWVVERRGTLLASGGDQAVLAWSTGDDSQRRDMALQRLEIPPWAVEGQAGGGPGHGPGDHMGGSGHGPGDLGPPGGQPVPAAGAQGQPPPVVASPAPPASSIPWRFIIAGLGVALALVGVGWWRRRH